MTTAQMTRSLSLFLALGLFMVSSALGQSYDEIMRQHPGAYRVFVNAGAPVFPAADAATPADTARTRTGAMAYASANGRVAVATGGRGAWGWVRSSDVVVPAGAVNTSVESRSRAIYDSLRVLPPSQLSERDVAWMQMHQQQQSAEEQQRALRSTSRAADAYVTLAVIGVVTSIALGVLAFLSL